MGARCPDCGKVHATWPWERSYLRLLLKTRMIVAGEPFWPARCATCALYAPMRWEREFSVRRLRPILDSAPIAPEPRRRPRRGLPRPRGRTLAST
jgi:hypothetical protein